MNASSITINRKKLHLPRLPSCNEYSIFKTKNIDYLNKVFMEITKFVSKYVILNENLQVLRIFLVIFERISLNTLRLGFSNNT